jgi:ABC-2 type transport system permease protein
VKTRSAAQEMVTPDGMPLPEAGRVRSIVDFYLTTMRVAVAQELQYRVGNYLYMIGMIAEPVIYLVVWSTIAREQGGSVDGLTPGDFAAYYIVWTLVRNMNIVFTPYGWESRIREGQLSGQLLRPLHPVHYDLAYFAGWKFAVILLWLPIAVVLSLVFHPTLHPAGLDIAVFAVAIWGAYLIRSFNLWLLGMVSFWTTRVSALYEVYFVAELLFSGRLVPLQLMPRWAQTVASALPFKWTFGFPIEALVSNLPRAQLLGGLGMQLLWTVAGAVAVQLMWRRAVRRYTAVGN